MLEHVGYLLKNTQGEIVDRFGGGFGATPQLPSPLVLPSGDQVWSPEVGVFYEGFVLENWFLERPIIVPEQAPMWAVRTILDRDGLLVQAQALIDASSDVALKNVWEYGNFASRRSPAIMQLAFALGLTDTQIDEMFIAANSLIV